MVSMNSIPGELAYIWQIKWLGIIAIKTESTQLNFLVMFSSPPRRWILKSLLRKGFSWTVKYNRPQAKAKHNLFTFYK